MNRNEITVELKNSFDPKEIQTYDISLLEVEVEKVDNRLRKYYKLTEKGNKETVNRLSELEEFIKNMQNIVNPKLSY